MSQFIVPGSTIGIIGGGQLGRMMALSARQMGYRIAVLEPTHDSPCAQVADVVIEAAYDDLEAAKALVEASDVITYEFENIDEATAQWISEKCEFPQGYDLLKVTQHRLYEKDKISSLGVEVAPYAAIYKEEDVAEAAEKIGFPAVLKTCRGGYDGKGQAVVKNEQELKQAVSQLLKQGELVLEGWVPFQCEISVIVTRSTQGETKTLPVAENIHRNNILHQSIVPARIKQETQDLARSIAMTLADGLELIGTLAVEMFVKDGKIVVNELAPRPHNSGHYSIEACETSQFEQHIRAICGWPLGETTLHSPVVMENVLGEHVDPMLKAVPLMSGVKLHLYGKKEAVEKRKMGHMTALGKTVEEALGKLNALHKN
ncbi:5-(carboxyamino)imidazole ribonucleotide synthase [Halalkalibacter urbisdiaboli]|uniref:5-(carboxyamino)imidazole ribonucleotide synthase n=1 Tax=Halalkalibacter urbisdiaboli TaxID=1960589 RepID=UPI000B42F561|nr:5-(carboxyamino)imidazole ribonucleotide synthase [Halalkalibacter urbisdiaboli]